MTWWWSYLLTVVGVTGLYFAGKKRACGWAIGIGVQILWFAYAVSTEQYGFIAGCVAYGFVNVKNYRSWRLHDRTVAAETQTALA